jgi:serine/threonine protein kinase
MGSRQIGNYRVIEYVGSGGFGSVFKAEDVNSPGRIVAIKELHKKHTRSTVIKQRFFQEALAMARLDHPNLPRLYTFGEDNGCYYLVMEFVSGSPLNEELEDKGPFPPDSAVPIITQVLDAVGYAHKNGVIHRDLKPDNIILVRDKDSLVVKVLDFGIAKMVGGENLTMTGEGFGTPSYMSPERILGRSELDLRTDIYSVGIILFEMLTGAVPFRTTSTDPALFWAEMRRLHETEPIPPLSGHGVSPELEAIIRKATAKRVEDRYATAEEMLAALRGGEATASLLLFTSPGSADVFIDNIQRGTSDEARGRLLIEGLTPGLHNVRVARSGYDSYKIDMVLEANRRTDLQVQLPARSTVAMPRFDDAGQPDAGTSKIASGDNVKTAMLVFESLPAGSSIALAGGQRVLAGEDGRATVPLGPGTHEIEFTDPSGGRKRETVTITDQELGSFKTVAMEQAPRFTDAPPQNPGQNPARNPGGYAQPAPTPRSARAAVAVAPAAAGSVKRSTGKIVAAVISVAIFAALGVAAILVIRGPGKAHQQQAATDLNAVASAQTPSPGPQPTVDLSAGVASPTPTPTPSANKNAAASKDDTKKETPQPTARPIEEETPKPGRNLHDNSPVTVPPATPLPTPALTRPADDADTEGGTCLIVIVTGQAGTAVAGARVAVTDEPSIYQGFTGANGRWRRCGLTPGHRVMVRVFKEGNMIGARQDVLTAGRNFIAVQVPVDPYSESSRPGRKPGVWQRQP